MFKKVLLLGVILISTYSFANESVSDTIDWSYVGRTGSDHWSKLDKKYMECNYGNTQSPINLEKEHLLSNKEKIKFHYEKCDNISSFKESKHIEIGNKIYKLIKFHFHMPSEHSIDHMRYPAELHLVHMDDKGKLAVVGIFITIGKESNNTIDSIIAATDKSNKEKYDVEDGDLMSLIPEDKSYFHYQGSLTTPPCSDGVEWYVLKNPLAISQEEMKGLRKLIPEDNSRPIQDAKNRIAQ